MMTVKVIGSILKADYEELRGHTVIVCDSYGNPIAVVQETADNVTTVSHAAEADFQRVLHVLGLNKLVTNETIECPAAPAGSMKISPDKLGEFVNAAGR